MELRPGVRLQQLQQQTSCNENVMSWTINYQIVTSVVTVFPFFVFLFFILILLNRFARIFHLYEDIFIMLGGNLRPSGGCWKALLLTAEEETSLCWT